MKIIEVEKLRIVVAKRSVNIFLLVKKNVLFFRMWPSTLVIRTLLFLSSIDKACRGTSLN